MSTVNPPVNAVAYVGYLCLKDFSVPGSFKATPTLASGDFKVSDDTGALANLGTLPDNQPASSIWVRVQLSSSEMTADNVKVQAIDQTSPKEWSDQALLIQPAAFAQTVPQTGDAYTLVGAAGGGLTALGDTRLAHLDADVSSRLAGASYSAAPTAIQNADAYLDRVNGIETGLTPRQAMRLEIAALVGKLSGAGSNTITIRDINDTVDRIVATVDSFGDRTAVTTNVT